MTDSLQSCDQSALPTAPSGWSDHAYCLLIDGCLGIVRTRRAQDSVFQLSVFDGKRETGTVLVPSCEFALFDRMSDGRWLVVSSRTSGNDKNGFLYSANGEEERRLFLGDGIQNLICSPDGTLWVAYFDEGIFACRMADGTQAVSVGGIAQFNDSGEVLWSFNQQAPREYWIDDAYATSLSGTTLWTCFYSSFPIAKVEQGQVACWSNMIQGASALAVQDDIVLLLGGYGDAAHRLAVLRLEGEVGLQIGEFQLSPFRQKGPVLLQGRDDQIHIVEGGIWSRIAVSSVIGALGAARQECKSS